MTFPSITIYLECFWLMASPPSPQGWPDVIASAVSGFVFYARRFDIYALPPTVFFTFYSLPPTLTSKTQTPPFIKVWLINNAWQGLARYRARALKDRQKNGVAYFLMPKLSNSRLISSPMAKSFLIALILLFMITTLLHRKIRIREKNRKLMTQRNLNSSSMRAQQGNMWLKLYGYTHIR